MYRQQSLYLLTVVLVTFSIGCGNNDDRDEKEEEKVADSKMGGGDRKPGDDENEKTNFEEGTIDYLALSEEMIAVLASIKDVDSAQKAIPKLEGFSKRGDELNERMRPLGQPSKETEKYLEEKYRVRLEKTMSELYDLMDQLQDNPEVWPLVKDALDKAAK